MKFSIFPPSSRLRRAGNFQFSNTERGAAALITVIFFLAITLVIAAGFSAVAISENQRSNTNLDGQKSYFLAEAGNEDGIYRLATGRTVSSQETITLDGHTASTTRATVNHDEQVTTSGDIRTHIRKVRTLLTAADSSAFNYGVQVGDGGLFMENSSSVRGNVYSNGPITGQNNNIIRGDAVSATTTGIIDGIHATGTARAHIIKNSDIDKDAYYQTISNTTVDGVEYPGSADQPKLAFPISDATIESWKNAATSTVISAPCPYKINSAATIGPARIACDVEIDGNNFTVTIAGMIWIEGNLTIKNGPTIKLASSLGNKSAAIIADKESNRLSSSKILVENSPVFQNSGTEGTYILLISMNNSYEDGGSEKAINVKNSASGDFLVYAPHGEILVENFMKLREITGYRVHTQNNAEITYEDGLANLLFDSGPSGGFTINSWQEIE